jgi:hypothetical protein
MFIRLDEGDGEMWEWGGGSGKFKRAETGGFAIEGESGGAAGRCAEGANEGVGEGRGTGFEKEEGGGDLALVLDLQRRDKQHSPERGGNLIVGEIPKLPTQAERAA